jgi:hypothetical protein
MDQEGSSGFIEGTVIAVGGHFWDRDRLQVG